MTVYNLYVFDRHGTCLYYGEWNRKNTTGISLKGEFKLMYGMLFSLKSFIKKLSPTDVKEGFLSYQTSKYKLHYYETPTGIKIVMNTDIAVGNVRDVLQRAYSTIYVDFVVRNPLCSLDEPIQSELFKQKIDAFVRGLPFFSARVT
uniref:Trafficking protein particle complex subunit n=1 Tax=Eptatretus burgeri TaxID=7764 RepID=A0A8C4RBF0_EPTBU